MWLDQDQNEITVSGTAQDNINMKEVRVVGDRILPVGGVSIRGKTLHFTYDVKRLQQGENLLKVIAVDQAGNSTTRELRMFVGTEAPIIRLTAVRPTTKVVQDEAGNIQQIETKSAALNIEGTVFSVTGVKEVNIRGRYIGIRGALPLMKEVSFRKAIALEIGPNEVVIEAVDMAGQTAEYVLQCIRVSESALTPGVHPDIQTIFDQWRIGDVYAVIIGIAEYQDQRLALRYAANDAQGFYEILIDPEYGRVPPEHVKLLLNQEATYDNIKNAIEKWLRNQATEEDIVLIYYSGHGAPEGDKTYWVTYQADIDDLYSTALSHDAIAAMFDVIQSERMVTFLDSCYSAATVYRKNRTKSMPVEIPLDKFSGAGRVTISASDGRQLSVELEEYGHGVFTYYLLEGLRGKADNNHDGVVTVSETWDYLKYQVTEAARKKEHNQTPMFRGEYTREIPLTFDMQSIRRNLIIDLFKKEEISPEQFNQALTILDSGQKDRILESFLAGEISLEIFRGTFK